MKKFAFGLSVLVSTSLGLVGCGSDSSSGGGDVCAAGEIECDGVCIDAIEPTLTAIQPDIFDISCSASACHDADLPQGELDLSSVAASEADLIDVDSVQVDGKRVASGDSANSYIMNKLLGQSIPAPYVQMPVGPTPLCASKIDVIQQWIDDGAPVN
jgi:hypothetical protein